MHRNSAHWAMGLVTIAAVVAVAPFGVGLLVTPRLEAQSPAPAGARPAFEVASIKPNSSADGRIAILGRPGQFVATNVTVQVLIQNAFRVQGFQVVGAPGWVGTDRFDINAKIPADSTGQQSDMVQSLLADRFGLTVHRETREMPVYALVLARSDGRLGPQLKKSDIDCTAPRGGGPGRGNPPPGPPPAAGQGPQCGARFGLGQFNASGFSLDQLATNLSRSVNRVVIDRTGLVGAFDVDLQWTPDPSQGPGPLGPLPPQLGGGGAPAPADGPSIFTAVQEQLGLKLDSQRGPVEVLVIDRIEKPTPD